MWCLRAQFCKPEIQGEFVAFIDFCCFLLLILREFREVEAGEVNMDWGPMDGRQRVLPSKLQGSSVEWVVVRGRGGRSMWFDRLE